MFIHLKQINQSYTEHFYDSMNYCCISFKASFYFFMHSVWPDIYEFDGSKTINDLNTILHEKKRKFKLHI